MIQYRLKYKLDQVAVRYQRLRWWRSLAFAWLMAAAFGLAAWGIALTIGGNFRLPLAATFLISAVLAAVGLWWIAATTPPLVWVARQVESAFPELRSCLLAAVEQSPDLPDGRYGYLQSRVIRDALTHADKHPWQEVVPERRIVAAAATQFLTLGIFLAALVVAMLWNSPRATSAAGAAGGQGESARGQFAFSVEPGSVEIERGQSLLALARVTGPMPSEGTLVFTSQGGSETRLEMAASLDDPIFAARIDAVREPLDYYVSLGGQSSQTYHVAVFEYPRLERADARLSFPKYTALEERLVTDVRSVSVVEGTSLLLICYLNKPVAQATLADGSSPPIPLSPAEGQHAYAATILCDKSRRLKLDLVDDAGRRNVATAEFSIQVLPNQPPTLKPVFPARDIEVSPLEELDVKATVWDDFGLARYGITYALAGQPPVEAVISENAAGRQRHELAELVRFEELKAEPDQLLSYFFWAEDRDAAGNVRLTQSDMYFAEVRPFDEIFRQGQQPPGGQQQQQGQGANAQQAQQLAQLQKEIINATWKLIRRESLPKLSEAFASDAEQVYLSQENAKGQVESLAQRVQDPQSQEHVAGVLEAMSEASRLLKEASDTPAAAPLTPALAAEQAAYQGLLKLRAREHEVIRQQQRQSGSQSSAARSQQQRQQMQQLDLQEQQNRYETQRTAQEQQQESAEERENRQVLNRLRELARRQHDLNERLKELQTALQEAQSEPQREEIREQLKRLQDEQQQILRDTDELAQRMDSPENQEQMSQERQQLDQTREQVQRASEALQQEQVSQAASSGTRAEREFEDLRNEFRRRAANRFSDEMRQMRDQARQLDERQQELGQQLQQSAQPDTKTKSLKDKNERGQIAEQLGEQRQRLAGLSEQMRRTIQDAEETEPLLAERLYDTARNLTNQNPERALEATQQSLRRGLADDARQQEEAARRGIGELREGIDHAAEAVVGDESEALRRAREELENLSRELNEEIGRNSPENRPQEAQPQNNQPEQQPGQKGDQKGQKGQPGSKGQAGQKGDKQGEKGQGGQTGQPGQKGQSGKKGEPGGEQPNGQSQGEDSQSGQQRQGQPQQGQSQNDEQQAGQRQRGQQQPGGKSEPRGARRLAGPAAGPGAGPFEDYEPRDFAPLTGEDFRDWSDRLRDVEELVEDPELRADAALIRDQARSMRAEFKRHSAEPNWELVRVKVALPLLELRDRIAQEVLRRASKKALVPLDRDPVPPGYAEKTRRYYERLGSGQ
jgi:hypothetical protein